MSSTFGAGPTAQERAAIVLKEVFDMTLDEIAEVLSTTASPIAPRKSLIF